MLPDNDLNAGLDDPERSRFSVDGLSRIMDGWPVLVMVTFGNCAGSTVTFA